MPKSKAEQLHDKYHTEFEAWFSNMHPNHNLTFDWESVFDSGWYKEPMAQGAWITWLNLTGKNTLPSTSDDIDAIATEVTCLNEAILNLTARANAVLIPHADKLIEDGKIDELKALVSTFPACSTRMTLAGKIMQAEKTQGERNETI